MAPARISETMRDCGNTDPGKEDGTHPGPARVLFRGLTIVSTMLVYLSYSTLAALMKTVTQGRNAGRRSFYRNFVRMLQRLGPTFVKFGQIMSARRDALPSDLCDEMRVLHDAVTPLRASEIRRALVKAYGESSDLPFRAEELQLVASGSVAGVFRAHWRDGSEVAVKLQRPMIEVRMKADLALLEALVRVTERLPKCQGMPLGDLMGYVSTVILGQLDFEREADSLSRLRKTLTAIPGVKVPAVLAEACRRGCLVMEFIPELDGSNVERYSLEERRMLAMTALAAARQMIFVDGFVHCDLHPGNLYVNRSGEVVIVDAGFSVLLPDKVRRLMAEFFSALARSDGRRCAEVIIESAVQSKASSDLDAFVESVVALVEAQTGATAPPFAMMSFGNALFDLQREFGLYAESDFAFPLIAMSVIESTARAFSPGLDFRELGRKSTSSGETINTGLGSGALAPAAIARIQEPYYDTESVG